jgi:hypothetical protein
MSTVSMAKTGTPFKQILLNAFACCNGIPFSLTEIFFALLLRISIEDKSQ